MTKRAGLGGRYDQFTPNQITDEKAARCGGPGVFLPYQRRYCESCARYVPYPRKSRTPSTHRKGWKCADCTRKQNQET